MTDGILTSLGLQAEENLGMVMIFTLVTAVQEKLNEMVDQIKNRREEEKERQEREAEEAEKVCATQCKEKYKYSSGSFFASA